MKNRMIVKYGVYLILFTIVAGLFYQLYVETGEKKQIEIIYIPKIIDDTNEFWSSVIAGAEVAAKEYDVSLTLMAPSAEADIDGQNALIMKALESRPDAIVISPSSYEKTTPYVRQVVEQGIKVVLVDSDIDEELAASTVATDNFEAGEKLGTYMRGFLPENPKIGLVGHVKGASTAIERERGIRSGLGEAGECVVSVVFCDSIYQTAYDVTKRLLAENPDINVLAGFNEYSSLGAATAIRDLGLQDQIATFGIDSSVPQIQLLEGGIYRGLVVQNPFNMGYMGIEQAVKCVRGEPVERFVNSGSELITKADIYTEDNQKLLFPFLGRRATKKESIQK